MKSILTRIELLEASRRSDPLLVLAEDEHGNTEKMTVAEMFDTGREFVRVVGGSRLSDLDRLLMAFQDKAKQAATGGVYDG